MGIEFEPWEPEETVGKLWHKFASQLQLPEEYNDAAVRFSDLSGRLAVLFRGLSGRTDVELRAVSDETSHHRLGWVRRLGAEVETLARASFDGEILRLPERFALYKSVEANQALYIWLTACAAHAPNFMSSSKAFRADLEKLYSTRQMVNATLENAPGLKPIYRALCELERERRGEGPTYKSEAQLEEIIRHLLGAPLAESAAPLFQRLCSGDFSEIKEPRGYKPFRPVSVWPDLRVRGVSEHYAFEDHQAGDTFEDSQEKTHQAQRNKADQAERSDSFILHKFEAILSWSEFLNLNRRVDDEDLDAAKKALDDHEHIGLGQISKAPATRLKLHLDLAPEDVDRERLSGRVLYPEWDVRTGSYLPDHVCVLTSEAERKEGGANAFSDEKAKKRIKAVKRQFEAFLPGRIMTRGHSDGEALDLEAAIRYCVDQKANHFSNDRIWLQSRPEARDLAVSILLDTSRSTESVVSGGRSVLEIEREALNAFAWGLDVCGDEFSIHAFSSLKRHRVYIQRCKKFDEPMSDHVEERIGSLTPGFYTRLGAAIRHLSHDLSKHARKRRLLLIITDGKPNDLDHYEGRHGIEDTAMAVREARRKGHAVFGVAVDRKSKPWFARMFGEGGFAVVSHPDKLIYTLPQIYRQLIGG